MTLRIDVDNLRLTFDDVDALDGLFFPVQPRTASPSATLVRTTRCTSMPDWRQLSSSPG